MFGSPGRSDPDEKDVRGDEEVDVVDMGSLPASGPVRIRPWTRRNCHAVEQKDDIDSDVHPRTEVERCTSEGTSRSS